MTLPMKTVSIPDNALAGKIVRDKRILAGLSMADLAKAMSILPMTLCYLERGKRGWTQAKFDLALSCIESAKGVALK